MPLILLSIGLLLGAMLFVLWVWKLRSSFSLLLWTTRKYRTQYESDAREKNALLWEILAEEYLLKRRRSAQEIQEIKNLMGQSYEDLLLRADMVLTVKESAKEFLRRLLISEKTFQKKTALLLEETEEIYKTAENLVRKVF